MQYNLAETSIKESAVTGYTVFLLQQSWKGCFGENDVTCALHEDYKAGISAIAAVKTKVVKTRVY